MLVREFMIRMRNKSYNDRVNFLKFVQGKRWTDARKQVIHMITHRDNEEKIHLELDMKILSYQLINKGYSEDLAKTAAANIIKYNSNYLYRSIDLRDYIINEDLTVVLKDIKKVIENLDNQINFKEMVNKNNKR